MYNILCAGCSFTAGWNHTSNLAIIDRPVEDRSKVSTDIPSDIGTSLIPTDYVYGHPKDKYEVSIEVKDFVRNPYVSYTNYLPETTYNIGRPASGIQSQDISRFIKRNRDIHLTHFIYQVPSPARQPKQLNHPYMWPFCGRENDILWSAGKKNRTVWRLLKGGNIDIFKNQHLFLNRALRKVDNNVNIIRQQHPDVKIIFLRYEESRHPLIAEFCEPFYKDMLPHYCEENNITYIYVNEFNTLLFYRENLTIDKVHPNIKGAKIIAKRIKKDL